MKLQSVAVGALLSNCFSLFFDAGGGANGVCVVCARGLQHNSIASGVLCDMLTTVHAAAKLCY